VQIAAYLGKGDVFDQAIADFSVTYAEQNARDYAALQKAVADGRVVAETASERRFPIPEAERPTSGRMPHGRRSRSPLLDTSARDRARPYEPDVLARLASPSSVHPLSGETRWRPWRRPPRAASRLGVAGRAG